MSSVSDIVSEDAFNGEATVLLDVDHLKTLDSNATKGDTCRPIAIIIISVWFCM